MSINDLLPSVASLSHADKFRLVHILLEQLAKEEGISTRQTPVQMEQMLIDHKTTMGRKPVNAKDISKAKNPDQRGSLAALQRAAALARETAIQTNTNIVIEKDGKLVWISAEELRRQASEAKESINPQPSGLVL